MDIYDTTQCFDWLTVCSGRNDWLVRCVNTLIGLKLIHILHHLENVYPVSSFQTVFIGMYS